jgi:hypothetical protein
VCCRLIFLTYFLSIFYCGVDLNYIGVSYEENSTVPSETVVKQFKKAVIGAGIIYKARTKVRWETAAEKRKRKHLRRDYLKKLEKENLRFQRTFEERFRIEYEGIP